MSSSSLQQEWGKVRWRAPVNLAYFGVSIEWIFCQADEYEQLMGRTLVSPPPLLQPRPPPVKHRTARLGCCPLSHFQCVALLRHSQCAFCTQVCAAGVGPHHPGAVRAGQGQGLRPPKGSDCDSQGRAWLA